MGEQKKKRGELEGKDKKDDAPVVRIFRSKKLGASGGAREKMNIERV